IFLDEIGDLDPASQVKLLRVLQDRTYEVLGSSKTKKMDVRVVCATNRNLEEMAARGTFREDLLYRINLITVKLPPLRERTEDIPKLVQSFLSNLSQIYKRPALSVTPQALDWLKQLPLHGNIRQLKNLVERSVLISSKDTLREEDFKSQVDQSPVNLDMIKLPDVGTISLEALEEQMVRKAMAYHRNKIGKAASALGLTRSSLYRRLEKYNIPYDEASD
ncbi:MAG: sigma-54-dependent Fis family transcriptional regulator, partial [Sphingobacteriales bacterium]